MIVEEPFPVTSQWALENLPESRRSAYEEYKHAVDYHLVRAGTASSDSSSVLWRLQWGRSPDWTELYVTAFEPQQLVWHGDVAVREAASALETALLLLNFVLDLGVDQTKIRWGHEANEGPLRRALSDLPDAVALDLVKVLDQVFGSIGYELLKGYRDWATHRGAPSLDVSVEIPGPLPTPKSALQELDEARREWLVQTHLLTTLPEAIKVRCWPFVPPVQIAYSIDIGTADEDIELPGGIRIEAGAQNVHIKDTRVASGSLTDDAEQFKVRNPLLLEKQRVMFAGEDLATYTAIDYIQALGSVVRFVDTALRGEWDENLRAVAQARAGT